MAEAAVLKTPSNIGQKAHPWRRCPIGKHLVREHLLHIDPNLVKALIASESSFEENPPRGPKTAHGLMQITDLTFPILSDTHGELKNYLVRVSSKELLDPSVNICIGVRWLFRKKETASNRLGHEATWFEAVEDYKSVLKKRLAGKKYNPKLMEKLHERYKPLQEAQSKLFG